ncbi:MULTISPECIES: anti-sigma factor family protein [Gracilibacillus]|uniref:anti-sigma factor family protein n=1 Tax=Gracilibacillus TaxID=74385 RepID=UPI00082648CF|nr:MULTISPECIES: anti-sigma factor [Gracilibacillus]
MKCNKEMVSLMHQYLDGEITTVDKERLRAHLQTCPTCQQHFKELKRAVALVTATNELRPSSSFTRNVMASLPNEKKRMTAKRWIRVHPLLTAAAVFFIFMFTGIFSAWNQEDQLSYSNAGDLVVENGTVIVPEGVVIEDDLEIKNGDVRIDGEVQGDVVIINGNNLTASAGKVAGDIKEVDQLFARLWYKIKDTTRSIFHLD